MTTTFAEFLPIFLAGIFSGVAIGAALMLWVSRPLQVNIHNAPSTPKVKQKGSRLDIDFDAAVAGIISRKPYGR